jgi:hypothetical protein
MQSVSVVHIKTGILFKSKLVRNTSSIFHSAKGQYQN